MMKRVSIIVPVYNKEEYLEQCLESLVGQTLTDIEIIVIDDGSRDRSYEIASCYQKKYSDKIRVYKNDKNSGIGKTRNYGLSLAQGEYVGFVDSDDYVEATMYQQYYEFAKKNTLDIVTGHYMKIYPNKQERVNTPYFAIGNVHSRPQILNWIDYGPCNKIFSMKMLREHHILFEEDLKYEDMPFVAKGLYHASRIGHIDRGYYCYRVVKNSETTTIDERVFDMFQIMNIVNSYYKKEWGSELEFLNINQITRYMLQQRYQKDARLRNRFIEYGYAYLDHLNRNWRQNPYFKSTSFLKKLVKSRRNVLKWYCAIYVSLCR